MHELLHHVLIPYLQLLLDPTGSVSPSNPTVPVAPSQDNAVKITVITTVGLVVATSITAFVSTFRRDASARSTVTASDNFTKQYILGLERDRKEMNKIRQAYMHLREAVIDRGINPDHLIAEQEHLRSQET